VKSGKPPLLIRSPVSGSVGPGNVGSIGETIVARRDQLWPLSVELMTATWTPLSGRLWSANWMNPSTSVPSGRTLMMLPIVPACVPGLYATRGVDQVWPPFVVREKNACCTYERACSRPCSEGGKPGGDKNRSQTA
jgi:hypothetical protein